MNVSFQSLCWQNVLLQEILRVIQQLSRLQTGKYQQQQQYPKQLQSWPTCELALNIAQLQCSLHQSIYIVTIKNELIIKLHVTYLQKSADLSIDYNQLWT